MPRVRISGLKLGQVKAAASELEKDHEGIVLSQTETSLILDGEIVDVRRKMHDTLDRYAEQVDGKGPKLGTYRQVFNMVSEAIENPENTRHVTILEDDAPRDASLSGRTTPRVSSGGKGRNGNVTESKTVPTSPTVRYGSVTIRRYGVNARENWGLHARTDRPGAAYWQALVASIPEDEKVNA